VVGAILHGIESAKVGIFNVAGDGKLSIYEIAQRLGKSCRVLPAGLIQTALWVLKKLKLTQYGPEQLDFLRYRPVLLNTRLKEEFGYVVLDRKPYSPNEGEGFSETKIFRKLPIEASSCA
jgi:UDP-glucose 4-epimerase